MTNDIHNKICSLFFYSEITPRYNCLGKRKCVRFMIIWTSINQQPTGFMNKFLCKVKVMFLFSLNRFWPVKNWLILSWNLGQKIVGKFTKFGKIWISRKCFTADFSTNIKICLLGGRLGTRHQILTFQGFSWNSLIF